MGMESLMQSPHRQPTFQITGVWAKNFRSIADTSVELDRLTVLVGPNASGKSNILDIMRFLKDALRFDLEAAVSIRHGIGAIHHQESEGCISDIEIGISATLGGYAEISDIYVEYGFALASEPDGGFKVSREYGKVWEGDNSGKPAEFKIENGNLVSPELLKRISPQIGLFADYANSDFDTTALAFPILLRIARRNGVTSYEDNGFATALMYSALWRLQRNLLDMRFYHIFPNAIRGPQKSGNAYPLNEDAGNLASTLRKMGSESPESMACLKESLGRLIPGISDLEVTPAGGYLVVRLKHDSVRGGVWFDLSQESDGTVRLLGLLAALYQRRYLPLIGIEEPELTVHPGALAVLADLLNEATQRSQIIVTTHSPDLIDCMTDYKHIEGLRIVELVNGATTVGQVSDTQIEAVKQNLFSPGELHRMGELELTQRSE